MEMVIARGSGILRNLVPPLHLGRYELRELREEDLRENLHPDNKFSKLSPTFSAA